MYKQLLSAIDKEIGPSDFAKYMVFHNRKLMKPLAEPKLFYYAVRRPDHFPEGIISVEVLMTGESVAEPISTQVRLVEANYPTQFCSECGEESFKFWRSLYPRLDFPSDSHTESIPTFSKRTCSTIQQFYSVGWKYRFE